MKKLIAGLLLVFVTSLFIGGCGPNMPKKNPKVPPASGGTGDTGTGATGDTGTGGTGDTGTGATGDTGTGSTGGEGTGETGGT